jgi:hypothetical protein
MVNRTLCRSLRAGAGPSSAGGCESRRVGSFRSSAYLPTWRDRTRPRHRRYSVSLHRSFPPAHGAGSRIRWSKGRRRTRARCGSDSIRRFRSLRFESHPSGVRHEDAGPDVLDAVPRAAAADRDRARRLPAISPRPGPDAPLVASYGLAYACLVCPRRRQETGRPHGARRHGRASSRPGS